MKTPTVYIVKDDQILANCLSAVAREYQLLKRDGKSLSVEMKEYKLDRGSLQNRYLHGWVLRSQIMQKLNDSGQGITDDDGVYHEWDVDMLRTYFKHPRFADQFVETPIIMVKGLSFRPDFHPSKLKKKDFALYCNLICDYAAIHWGVEVEPPLNDAEMMQIERGRKAAA